MNSIVNNSQIQQELIDPLLEKFMLSSNKLSELKNELTALCGSSYVGNAIEAIINSSSFAIQPIISVKEKTTLDLDKSWLESFRSWRYQLAKGSIGNSDPEVLKPEIAAKFWWELLQKGSSEQSLLRSLCSIPYISRGDEFLEGAESVMSSEFIVSMTKFLLESNGDLTSTLILLKYLVSQDYSNIIAESPVCSINSEFRDKLKFPEVVGNREVARFRNLEARRIHLESFETSPRIILQSGNPGKLSRLEVQGKATGFIGGISVTKNVKGYAYYETTLKGSCGEGIRLGWSRCGSSLSVPGDSADSWAIDGYSGCLYHNALERKQVALAALEANRELMKKEELLSASFNAVFSAVAPTTSANEIAPEPKINEASNQVHSEEENKSTTEATETESVAELSVVDGAISDPNLFFFPEQRFKSYLRLTKLGFSLPAIRQMILVGNLRLDDTEAFLAADSKAEKLGKKYGLNSQDEEKQLRSEASPKLERREAALRAELEGGISLLDQSKSKGQIFPWEAGAVIGSLLNLENGQISFFSNGMQIGTICSDIIGLDEVGVCPVFSCTASSGLEFNIGQGKFVHFPPCHQEAPPCSNMFPFTLQDSSSAFIITEAEVSTVAKTISFRFDPKSSCNEISEFLTLFKLSLGGYDLGIAELSAGKQSIVFSYKHLPSPCICWKAFLSVDGNNSTVLNFCPIDFADSKGKKNPKLNNQNRVGIRIVPGSDGCTLYCGRNLGVKEIPRSDGRCGPTNGPQCNDCKGLLMLTPLCNAAHEMAIMTTHPPEYSGAPMCDLCSQQHLSTNGKHFYHCSICGFDMCSACAVQWVSIAKNVIDSGELLPAPVKDPKTVSLLPHSKSSYVRLGKYSLDHCAPGAVLHERISSSFSSNATFEISFRLVKSSSTQEESHSVSQPICSFVMSTMKKGFATYHSMCLYAGLEGSVSVSLDETEVYVSKSNIINNVYDWTHLALVSSRVSGEEFLALYINGILVETITLSSLTSLKIVDNTRLCKAAIGVKLIHTMVESDVPSTASELSGESLPVDATDDSKRQSVAIMVENKTVSILDVSEFRVWSSARSNQQISTSLGRNKISGVESRLVICIPFEEGTGTTIHDCCGKNASGNKAKIGINGEFEWMVHEDYSIDSLMLAERTEKLGCSSSASLDCSLSELVEILGVRLSHSVAILEEGKIIVNGTEVIPFVDKHIWELDQNVIDPERVNFELISSILSSLLEIARAHSNVSFLQDICHKILKVVHLNLLAAKTFEIELSSIGFRHISSLNESNLTIRLLLQLAEFIGFESSGHGDVTWDDCREESCRIILDNLDIFFCDRDGILRILNYLLVISQDQGPAEFLNSSASKLEFEVLKRLKISGGNYFLLKVLQYLSVNNNAGNLIPTELFPVISTSGSEDTNSSNDIYHGCVVQRGQDWCYNDQDGGDSSKGIVVGISDWLGDLGKCVSVMWPNGSINSYRWNVLEVVGGNTVNRIDVKRIATGDSTVKPNSRFERKSLLFKPDEVTKLFTTELSSDYLVEILEYIHLSADKNWLREHNLTIPIEKAIKFITCDEVIRLYGLFFDEFSDAFEIPTNPSECLGSVDLFSKFFQELCNLSFCESSKFSPVAACLLQLIQCYLLGLCTSSNSNICGSVINRCKLHSFQLKTGQQIYWKWNECGWSAELYAQNGAGGDRDNAHSVRDTVLVGLQFEHGGACETLCISNQGTTVVQNAGRQWATCVGTIAMFPNSGVHRWYSIVERIGSRRCHCMLGVGTSETNLDAFLGQDSESWGINPNRELFHGGEKLKTDFSKKIEICTIVEMILDTDHGILSINDPNSSDPPVVAFQDLQGLVLFPAWSLYAQEDTISIIPVNSHVASKKLSSKLLTLTPKSSSSSPLKQPIDVPMPLGVPHTILVQYFERLASAATLLSKQPIPAIVESPILNLLKQVIARFFKWQGMGRESTSATIVNVVNLLKAYQAVLTRCRDENVCEEETESSEPVTSSLPDSVETVSQFVVLLSSFLGKLLETNVNLFCEVDNKTVAYHLQRDQLQNQNIAVDEFNYSKCFSHDNGAWLSFSVISKGLTVPTNGYLDFCEDLFHNTESTSASEFMDWIGEHDANYRGLSQTSPPLAQAIRLLFAAILHHCGYYTATCSLADLLHKSNFESRKGSLKPSYFVASCWENAMKLRMIVSKEAQLTFSTHSEIVSKLIPRIRFLFELSSASVEHKFDFTADNLAVWLDNYKDRIKHFPEMKEISELSSFVLTFVNSEVSYSAIRAHLITANNLAIQRKECFRMFQSILCLAEDFGWGVKSVILHYFFCALQPLKQKSSMEDGSVLIHYSHGIEGCSNTEKLALKGSFDSLFSYLVTELTASNTDGNLSLMMTILNCLGVALNEDDHVILSRVGVFFVLHEILDSFTNSDEESCSPVSKLITQAVMKLFTLLALQVSYSNEKNYSSVISTANRRLSRSRSGPKTLGMNVFDILMSQLNRIALSLRDSVMNSFASVTNGDNSVALLTIQLSAENMTILSEISSLLLCVSRDDGSRRILTKSSWISVMLELILSAPNACRLQIFEILSLLLPHVEISQLESSSFATIRQFNRLSSSETETVEEEIISFLLKVACPIYCPVVGRVITMKMKSVDSVSVGPQLGKESIADQCEAVALIRILMSTEKWKIIVERTLLNSFLKAREEYDMTALPSASVLTKAISGLSVLGGHIDAPYLQCPVFIADDSECEREFGIIVEMPANFGDLYTVEAISFLDSSLCQNAADGQKAKKKLNPDDLRPINRCPLGRLILSESLISSLLQLMHSLLVKSNEFSDAPKALSVKLHLFRTICIRSFSSLMAIPSVADTVLKLLSTESIGNVSPSEFLLKMLEKSVQITTSTGFSSISRVEDTFLVMQTQKNGHLIKARIDEAKAEETKLDATKSQVEVNLNPNESFEVGHQRGVIEETPIERSASSASEDSAAGVPTRLSSTAPPPTPQLHSPEPELPVESNLSSSSVSPSLTRSTVFSSLPAGLGQQDSEANRESASSSSNNSQLGGDSSERKDEVTTPHDDSMMDTLLSMGFPRSWCVAALNYSSDFDEAVNYILNHGPELERMDNGKELGEVNDSEKHEVNNAFSAFVEGEEGEEGEGDDEEEEDDEEETEESPFVWEQSLPYDQVEVKHLQEKAEESWTTVNFVPPVEQKSQYGIFEKTSFPNGPKEFHYDGNQVSLLPFFAEPSVSSERLGCIFPADDVWAYQELRDPANKSNSWLQIRVCDYDDESIEFVDISSDEFHETFAWVPMYVESQQVVLTGSCECPHCPVEHPKGASIFMDESFLIHCSQEISVREAIEIGTTELLTIQSGQTVHAISEAFNSDGILCLELNEPVHGWVSKYVGVFHKIAKPIVSSNDSGTSGSSSETSPSRKTVLSEWDKLLALDDNLEQCEANETYRRDSRFFHSLQGNQFQRVFEADSKQRINSKISNKNSPSRTKDAFPANQIDDLTMPIMDRLCSLYIRKSFLAMWFRSAKDEQFLNRDQSRIPKFFEILTSKVDPISDTSSTTADKITTFFKLVLFRGNPYYSSLLEHLAFHEIRFAAIGNDRLTVDMVLRPYLATMLRNEMSSNGSFEKFRAELCDKFLKLITVELTSAHYCDQIWLNDSYVDDFDTDCTGESNIHLAVWMSNLLIDVHSLDITQQLFKIWCLGGLKSPSMSLKFMAFEILSKLISDLKINMLSSSLSQSRLEECLKLLPLDRLSSMASKRLWYEMEDDPSYSRFLQALLHLISECRLAQLALSTSTEGEKAAQTILSQVEQAPSTERSFLSFDGLRSHVVLNPAKEISGPWTAECWIRLHDAVPIRKPYEHTAIEKSHSVDFPQAVKRNNAFGETIGMNLPEETVDSVAHLFQGIKRSEVVVDDNSFEGLRVSTSPPKSSDNLREPPLPIPPSDSPRPTPIPTTASPLTAVSASPDIPAIETIEIAPMTLFSSSIGSIRLKSGGKLFTLEIDDPLATSEFVPDKARTLSLMSKDGTEYNMDCVIPENKWVHIAIVQSGTPSNILSVYVDGVFCDQVATKFSLPLSVLGSTKEGHTLNADVAEVRVWSTARTCSEIMRDMNLEVGEARGLISHLRLAEGSGLRIADSVGLFSTCQLNHCSWNKGDAPVHFAPHSSYFMLSESEEQNGLFGESIGRSVGVIEMTGVLSLCGLRDGALGAWSRDRTEVVCLAFRVCNEDSLVDRPRRDRSLSELTSSLRNSDDKIEGYLDWSERGIRSKLSGILSCDGSFQFHISSNSTILGPQSEVNWEGTLALRGNLSSGCIDGTLSFEALVPYLPPLKRGEVLLDKSNVSTSLEISLDGRKGAHALLKEDTRKGFYIATVKLRASVSPPPTSETPAECLLENMEASQTRPDASAESFVEIPPSPMSIRSLHTQSEADPEDASVQTETLADELLLEQELPYGLTEGSGAIWVEWQVVNSRGSIVFGVCTSSFAENYVANLSNTESTVSDENAWAYHQFGLVTFGSEKTDRSKFREGDTVGVQIDSLHGTICFYRNGELVQIFENVSTHPSFSSEGVRPFVILSRSNDEVKFLGVKEGAAKVSFGVNACVDNRKTICGNVHNGYFSGVCTMHFHDKNGYWFGNWKDNYRFGAQVWISTDEQGNNDHIEKVSIFDNEIETFTLDNIDELPEGAAKFTNLKDSIDLLKFAFEDFLKMKSKNTPSKTRKDSSSESTDEKSVRSSTKRPSSEDSHITIHVHDGLGHDLHFKVSRGIRMKKVFDVYAIKRKVNLKNICFYFKSQRLTEDTMPETLDMGDNDMIVVSPYEPLLSSNREGVENLIATSSARFILEAILPTGATVRNGIEIEDSAPVRLLVQHEVVEAFDYTFTKEGIGRFKILDGWISEKLRGGTEDIVVTKVRELFPMPVRYKVLRVGGAKVRQGYSLSSSPIGFCPEGMEICVAESRQIHAEEGEEATVRLRICSPEAWVGWVSGKSHILVALPDSQQLKKSENRQAVEISSELSRRAEIRKRRKTRKLETEESLLKSHLRRTSINGSLKLDQDTLFLMNPQNKPPGVVLSPDYRTVSCEGRSSGRAMVLGTRGFTRGLHYWEVQVDAASWGSVFIGVAPADATGWSGYGFLNYRATQAFGNETLYGSYYAANDTVGVLLDMDHGTISFFKDGENLGRTVVIDMGVAYHNLRRQSANRSASSALFPCFGVKSAGDQLSIRRRKWISRRGLSPASLLEQIIDAKMVISKWRHSYFSQLALPIPLSLIKEMYGAYVRWRGHNKEIVISRAGIEVAIDTSEESIANAAGTLKDVFQLKAGSKFSSLYGDGHLLGVRSGKLWFVLESGENGAWFWNEQELHDLVNSASVCFKTDEEESKESSDTTELSGDATAAATASTISASVATSTPQLLTLSDFVRSMTEVPWTLHEDETITKIANNVADKFGFDNLLIPADVLEKYRTERNLLPKRSSMEFQARYAALCVLNRAISTAVPLIDVGCNENRLPLVHTDYHEELLSRGFDEGMVLNRHSTLARSQSGKEILDLKRTIFTRTKLELWDRALVETTTPTGAPPDEFERPEDLREIKINRPEALNVNYSKATLPERLRKTIFGQTMDQLKNWEDRSLRRSFVHVEDAGQRRAFFVKFIGEGVDDHGGPYRAVFQSAVGEEPAGTLELVVPCPNGRGEAGENRDKLVMNPTYLWSPDKLSLFDHLGKLIAMGCRHKILVPLSLPSLIWKPLAGEQVTVDDLEAIDYNAVTALDTLCEPERLPQEYVELLIEALLNAWALPASSNLAADISQAETSRYSEYATIMATRLVVGHSLYKYTAVNSSNDNSETLSISRDRAKKISDLILHLRMTSHKAGIDHLYKGMASVIPAELLALFTDSEIEKLFCGENDVNLELLKEATVYDCVNPTDPHIKYFWQALELMTPEERSQLINFCSGRSRLPASMRDFPMRFKLSLPPPQSQKDPDSYLPIAQTCFFNLSLPKYSSVEVCLEKLKYSIRNTHLMDADFAMRNAEGWQNI